MTLWSSTEVVGAAAALVTGVVLLWAGVAKLTRPTSTAQSFAGLAIPFARFSARAVPLVEVAVGVCCVVRPRVGAAAAGLMLVLFTALLATHVRNGSRVSCGCFGSAAPAPVTWVTLVRNSALILLATSAALWSPGTVSGAAFRDLLAIGTSAVSLATAGALMIGMVSLKNQVGSVFSQQNRKGQSTT